MDSYLSDIWKRTLTLILEKGKQQEKLDNLIFNQFFSDSKLMDLDEKKAHGRRARVYPANDYDAEQRDR